MAEAPEGPAEPVPDDDRERSLAEVVEERYDFDNFGPADMAEMSVEEWEAAFDPDAWITGDRLLDRVAADLAGRVADRSIFAVVERASIDGEAAVLAYDDVSYAAVFADGRVEGEGPLRRDVEPVVALCSMADYTPASPPEGASLPEPSAVVGGSGDLGNRLLQAVAGALVLAGLALLAAPFVATGRARGTAVLTTVLGLGFAGLGLFLFVMVANARLSDRFRAEEYRHRLEAAGVGRAGRPDFLPVDDDESEA